MHGVIGGSTLWVVLGGLTGIVEDRTQISDIVFGNVRSEIIDGDRHGVGAESFLNIL